MKHKKSGILYIVIVSMLLSVIIPAGDMSVVLAKDKVLTLQQAQSLALANCINYKKILNKIDMQEIKYAAAIKSIKMKKKNMSTFRWTPLLSFKFPEQPALADEYEWQYKPLQIDCVITQLKHQLQDELSGCREKISLLYIEAYVCQEKIAFYNENLEQAQKTLKRNRARLVSGQGTQSDIDKMEQSIDKLKTELVLQMRNFETKKSKITDMLKLDVTSGYEFKNPFVETNISRNALEALILYTLKNDQSFYETRLETQLSLTSLNMMERLMRNQYGNKMNMISAYIAQAKEGKEIDSYAFKQTYNQMLNAIDAPWNGEIRIWFIRITKEWFKGAIDGSRYVEDDPYALYSGALDYADAVREQAAEEKELTNTVKDSFETLMNIQNAYRQAKERSQTLEKELKKSKEKNRLGELSYEELADIQKEYQQQELDTLELLAEYSKQLYAYDRLTCGGISAYLSGTDLTMNAAQGGNSFLAKELKGKAYYYINYKIEDNVFAFGVSIPEDYSLEITHFALYVDGTKIGDKTETSENLEHLAFALDMVEKVQVYLYNEEELVDVCEIDAAVSQEELAIVGGYTLVNSQNGRTVADYTCQINESTQMAILTVRKRETEPIAYYQLTDNTGKALIGEELTAIAEPFSYLSILTGDVNRLHIQFYDASKSMLYSGVFQEGASIIVVE